MPFLTEELWHAVYDSNSPAKSIALTKFPTASQASFKASAMLDMKLVQKLVTEVRGLRKEIGIEERVAVPIEVRSDPTIQTTLSDNRLIIEKLARVQEVRFVNEIAAGLSNHSTSDFDVAVIYQRTIDVPAERERKKKDIAQQEKIIASSDRQLNNPGFLAKAPAHIVEGLKKQREEAQRLLDKLRSDLDSLPE
jgi:valyl-tRNA synthetase